MVDLPRRPCLALPFTIIPADDGVHLLAGEDWRYLLTGAHLASWLPAWLALVDGQRTRENLLELLPREHRVDAEAVLVRLQGERLVREGPVEAGHRAVLAGVEVIGQGHLAEALRSTEPTFCDEPASSERLILVVQDSLDFTAALAHNARLHQGGRRWMWVCSGAMTRGYVSPLFLPDAGPCLACLVQHFRRLSPAPHLYDLLEGFADIRPSPLPSEATSLLTALTLAKVALAGEAPPRPPLYRLHVLESDTLEVTTHAVPRDPKCTVCGAGP